MPIRLLPGDYAPSLKLARVFNRADFGPVIFDRPSVVVLWNADCAGCLPAIGELAAFVEPLGVPLYAVAIMVRDVAATAAAAQGSNAAVLALEEPPFLESVLSRGAATCDWLEASGSEGVPTAYVINGKGILAWIGDPEDAKQVVSAVLSGTWDVPAARVSWRKAVMDEMNLRKRAMREIMGELPHDRLSDTADHLVDAERASPASEEEAMVAYVKLDILMRADGRTQEAEAYYGTAAKRFRGNTGAQVTLGMAALSGMRDNLTVARAVRDAMLEVTAGDDWLSMPTEMQLATTLLLADAEARLGLRSASEATLAKTGKLAQAPGVPEQSRKWADSEIRRMRGL